MAVFWVVAPCSLVEVTNVSEVLAASIIRALVNFYQTTLIALMVEAARTSETLVNFYRTARRYNPEDSHLSQYFRLWIGRGSVHSEASTYTGLHAMSGIRTCDPTTGEL
jgi:hypothetical protein